MIKIWEYKNIFSSELSSFKYNRYWNDILFFTNHSDLPFLISKNGVPSSSLAPILALTQVFLILTYFPFSSNMNCSIITLCLWSRKQKLYGKNIKFSDLASLVTLRICFGLQDNSDAPFTHLFYLTLHHVKFEEWPE